MQSARNLKRMFFSHLRRRLEHCGNCDGEFDGHSPTMREQPQGLSDSPLG